MPSWLQLEACTECHTDPFIFDKQEYLELPIDENALLKARERCDTTKIYVGAF